MKSINWLIYMASAAALISSGRGWASADTPTMPSAGVPAVAAADTLNVVLALLLVVGLIVALAWLLRRSGLAPLGAGGAARVLASLPLGGRERAALIEVGGQQLLLGVAAGQVNLLVRFEQPVVEAPPAPGEFAVRLKQWLDAGKRQ